MIVFSERNGHEINEKKYLTITIREYKFSILWDNGSVKTPTMLIKFPPRCCFRVLLSNNLIKSIPFDLEIRKTRRYRLLCLQLISYRLRPTTQLNCPGKKPPTTEHLLKAVLVNEAANDPDIKAGPLDKAKLPSWIK